jgi:choline dehydrogenase-like flavoprotein
MLESGGFEYEAEIQDLNKGESTGQQYYPLQSARLRYFGGTTGHWAGMCSPFDPIDFETRDYVPHSGWPIRREALDSTLQHWQDAAAAAEKDNTGRIARAFQLNTRIEQAPNPDSRVTLSTEKDELGVPRANLHWALTELDKRSIRTLHFILGQQIGQAGLGRVKLMDYLQDENDYSWPEGTDGGWHHMGTTRMSDDPRQGVVDANCQIHGIQNLYVAGAACYATSAAPNPTLTLVALSLRLSDFLKRQVG